jgi:hypothetical protein
MLFFDRVCLPCDLVSVRGQLERKVGDVVLRATVVIQKVVRGRIYRKKHQANVPELVKKRAELLEKLRRLAEERERAKCVCMGMCLWLYVV